MEYKFLWNIKFHFMEYTGDYNWSKAVFLLTFLVYLNLLEKITSKILHYHCEKYFWHSYPYLLLLSVIFNSYLFLHSLKLKPKNIAFTLLGSPSDLKRSLTLSQNNDKKQPIKANILRNSLYKIKLIIP